MGGGHRTGRGGGRGGGGGLGASRSRGGGRREAPRRGFWALSGADLRVPAEEPSLRRSGGFLLKNYRAKLLAHNIRRRSQVVRQRSAKPPFVGSIPTGASLSHNHLGPPRRGLFSRLGRFLGRFRATCNEPA